MCMSFVGKNEEFGTTKPFLQQIYFFIVNMNQSPKFWSTPFFRDLNIKEHDQKMTNYLANQPKFW